MSSSTANPTRQQLEELDALLQRMLSLPLNQLETEPAAPPPPPPILPAVDATPTAVPNYTFSAPPAQPVAPPRPVAPRPSPSTPARPMSRPMPSMRRVEVAPGDHSWNVPLPAAGGVSTFGQWPGGDPLSAAARPIVPPPPPAPPSGLRVTTVPSPDEQNLARETPPPMQRLRVESPAAETVPPANRVPGPPVFQEPPLPFYLWPVAGFDWTIGRTLGVFGGPGRWVRQGGGKLLVGWCGVFMLCGAIAWGVVDYFGLSW
ncbi:MAG: hypothetical protein ACJ8F7_17000 [Gemmataceae bacterium]